MGKQRVRGVSVGKRVSVVHSMGRQRTRSGTVAERHRRGGGFVVRVAPVHHHRGHHCGGGLDHGSGGQSGASFFCGCCVFVFFGLFCPIYRPVD